MLATITKVDKNDNNIQLPQTGDQYAVGAIIFGAMMAMFGLTVAGMKRKD
ncbi:LPXTG cell wall anchor domain-containing protein [Limosilactobacillus frumenti]|nr:LPXTG cell wall anchor domain-containing protein [Limosilactobacillus frumenti]MBA2913690.1 LPXTG cell wall anchor domain-containing protein [Limosilactobacillus frumenti]